MKKHLYWMVGLVIAVAVIFTLSAQFSCSDKKEGATTESSGTKSGEEMIVGGPCSYDEHGGECRIEQIRDEEAIFTFVGVVASHNVKFTDNSADGAFDIDKKYPCRIKFITKGACTPCGFEIDGKWGSCGKEAWEFFRSRDSIAK